MTAYFYRIFLTLVCLSTFSASRLDADLPLISNEEVAPTREVKWEAVKESAQSEQTSDDSSIQFLSGGSLDKTDSSQSTDDLTVEKKIIAEQIFRDLEQGMKEKQLSLEEYVREYYDVDLSKESELKETDMESLEYFHKEFDRSANRIINLSEKILQGKGKEIDKEPLPEADLSVPRNRQSDRLLQFVSGLVEDVLSESRRRAVKEWGHFRQQVEEQSVLSQIESLEKKKFGTRDDLNNYIRQRYGLRGRRAFQRDWGAESNKRSRFRDLLAKMPEKEAAGNTSSPINNFKCHEVVVRGPRPYKFGQSLRL